jgi:hypothetical protein
MVESGRSDASPAATACTKAILAFLNRFDEEFGTRCELNEVMMLSIKEMMKGILFFFGKWRQRYC